MRKELKEKLVKQGYKLYESEWIEKVATDGFNDAMDGLREKEPEFAKAMERCLWPFEIMYYHAFDRAWNTFVLQVLEDDVSELNLHLGELCKLTAKIKEKQHGED